MTLNVDLKVSYKGTAVR